MNVVCKTQMSSSVHWVSVGTLVQNYNAINIVPTQKGKLLLLFLIEENPPLPSWNECKLGHGYKWGSQPGMSVLTRTRKNLTGLCYSKRDSEVWSVSSVGLIYKKGFGCNDRQKFTWSDPAVKSVIVCACLNWWQITNSRLYGFCSCSNLQCLN